MSELLKLFSDIFPVSVVILGVVFIYLLILFKGIAERFISIAENQTVLAETQTKYIQERLNVVEKTLGISDRAFDLQEKQIKKLEQIAQQQGTELLESDKARQAAEASRKEAEERYARTIEALELKDQQVVDLQSAQMQVEFTSTIEATTRLAHDLMPSVQAITAYVENLLSSGDLDLNSEERMAITERLVDQTERLGLQLQTAVYAGIGKEGAYKRTKFDLGELLLDSLKLFGDQAKAKQLEIRLQMEPSPPLIISGDVSKVRLALWQVIENAVKYSFVKTTIVIRTERREGFVRLTIENAGVGIYPSEGEQVFMPGFRGRMSLDQYRSGTGMGLFVARRILTAHAGDIRISGDMVKDGQHKTTVEISLPLA